MAGNSQATGTGMLLGTPAFMAPEQVIGKPSDIDTRVDLWATGATMFNLLSGQMVHEAETGPQLMVKLATQPTRALHDVAPDAPPAIAAAVDRGLAFDKNLRWQTAGEMQAALRAACTTSFGDFNGRAILAKLVASAKPMAGRAGASPSSAQASPPASFGTPPPRTATAPGVRAVTASPISTSSAVYQDPPASVPVTSRKGSLAVIAGIGALAIAGLVVAVLHKGPPTAPAEGPAASAPPAPLPPPTRATPAPTEIPTEVPAATIAPAPAPLPPDPRPEPAGPSKHPRQPAASHDAGAGGHSGPAKANCNPPYTLDANGEKHFKPECF
jgi:eukaryotic-like serine/threonine-protein kinase